MLRNNPTDWYLIDGEQHWKVDDLLAEVNETAESVGGTSAGSVHTDAGIPEPAPVVPTGPAAPPAPQEWQVVVRESKASPGNWFVWHKELKMSRWVHLQTDLPSNARHTGWDRGEQDGHEYLVPTFCGGGSDELMQENAVWVPCRLR